LNIPVRKSIGVPSTCPPTRVVFGALSFSRAGGEAISLISGRWIESRWTESRCIESRSSSLCAPDVIAPDIIATEHADPSGGSIGNREEEVSCQPRHFAKSASATS